MGVGLNTHLSGIMHGVAHLTGRDRPCGETVRVPLGVKKNGVNVNGATDHPVPPPSLQTLQYLFAIQPSLNPQASPTVYKLESSFTQSEVENASPPDNDRSRRPAILDAPAPPTAAPAVALSASQGSSPVKAATALHAAAGQGKIESVATALVNTGLLKIDKAGHQDGDERKREKKHNLHWKYEDPALIFKDLLG